MKSSSYRCSWPFGCHARRLGGSPRKWCLSWAVSASLRPAAPSTARSRSPVWWTGRRACPPGCDGFPPARTRRPGWTATFTRERPRGRARSSLSPASVLLVMVRPPRSRRYSGRGGVRGPCGGSRVIPGRRRQVGVAQGASVTAAASRSPPHDRRRHCSARSEPRLPPEPEHGSRANGASRPAKRTIHSARGQPGLRATSAGVGSTTQPSRR